MKHIFLFTIASALICSTGFASPKSTQADLKVFNCSGLASSKAFNKKIIATDAKLAMTMLVAKLNAGIDGSGKLSYSSNEHCGNSLAMCYPKNVEVTELECSEAK